MKYLVSLFILFAALLSGYAVVTLFNLQFPPAVIGMLLLVLAMKLGVVSLEKTSPFGQKLLTYFPLFFIPAGVGVIAHRELIMDHLYAVVLSVLLATLSTLFIVGLCAKFLFRKGSCKK